VKTVVIGEPEVVDVSIPGKETAVTLGLRVDHNLLEVSSYDTVAPTWLHLTALSHQITDGKASKVRVLSMVTYLLSHCCGQVPLGNPSQTGKATYIR